MAKRAGARGGLVAAGLFVSCLGVGPLFAEASVDCASKVDEGGQFSLLLQEARRLYDVGCLPEAGALAERLLVRAEDEHGPDSLEVADVLDVLTEKHFWLAERGEREIERGRRAARIRQALPTASPAALARSHRNLGALLSAQLHDEEALAEALEHFDEARSLWQREIGLESAEVADLYTWIAELLCDWADTGSSRARLMPWISELLDPQTPGGQSVARIRGRITAGGRASSERQRSLGRLAEDPALVVALRAVALAETLGSESPAYAESLNTLGNLLHRRQLYDEALAAFDECLEVRIRAFPPGHPQIARAYHNRGEARLLVGDLDGARPDLETAYQMRLELAGDGFPGRVSTTLRVLGRLLLFTGDLQGAVSLYRDALPRLSYAYGVVSYYYTDGLVNLAEAYEELGESREAERYYGEALTILAESAGAGGARTAAVLSRLGGLLLSRGDLEAGEDHLQRARTALESLPELPLEDYSQTLRGLATVAASKGDSSRALDLLRSSVEVLDRYRGSHPALVDLLLDTARLEVVLGLGQEAEETLDRVAKLEGSLGQAAHGIRARHRLLRAHLAAEGGEQAKALGLAAEAAFLHARHLAPAARVLPPDSALRYALENREALDLALTLLRGSDRVPGEVERVWSAVALNRGLIVDELEHRYAAARSESDPELRRLLEELDQARRHLAETQVRVRPLTTVEERRTLLRYADRRVRAAERALAERMARLRLDEVTSTGPIADVVEALPGDSALIAFVRYRDRGAAAGRGKPYYGAFVASAGTADARFVDLGPAEELDRRVETWRSTLLTFEGGWLSAESRLRAEGISLRRALWDPVVRHSGDADRLFVVPDGAVALVSLAGLPADAQGRYLVEEPYETHRLVAERDVLRRSSEAPPGEDLLVVGGPDFNAGSVTPPPAALAGSGSSWFERIRETTSALFRDFLRDPCLGEDTLYFLPLPQAGTEVELVGSIFRQSRAARGLEPRVTSLVGAEATETEFKRLASSHSVLHVATHGFFDLRCRRGRGARDLDDLLLDAGGRETFVSGLAFAGANHQGADSLTEDDGILTVSELASLDLSGVDWVVLSACETGVGQLAAGEGVMGLGRGFQVAGADTLVLTLWPVEDRAATEWVTELYRSRFERGAPAPTALRSASLTILEQRREDGRPTHPYFWSSFVAMGAWE